MLCLKDDSIASLTRTTKAISMKKSVLLVTTLLIAARIIFSSDSNGPGFSQGTDRTGSPLGDSFCADCHSSGRYSTSLQVEMLDGTTPVTSYTPNKKYTLQVKVVAGSGTPAGYGYQTTVLQSGTNNQAGTLGPATTGQRVITLGGRQYAEHTRVSVSNVFQMAWTAPASGTGNINVYAAGLAANGSGSSGDGAAKNALALTEATSTALPSAKKLPVSIKVYPNPVIESALLEINGALKTNRLWVELIDAQGRKVQKQQLQYSGQNAQIKLDFQDLPHGNYWARVSDGERLQTVSIAK